MINLHERMLPTSAGVEPATFWSPVGRRIQLSHQAGRIRKIELCNKSLALEKVPFLFNCKVLIINESSHIKWTLYLSGLCFFKNAHVKSTVCQSYRHEFFLFCFFFVCVFFNEASWKSSEKNTFNDFTISYVFIAQGQGQISPKLLMVAKQFYFFNHALLISAICL